jgi:hypothetical protein
MAARIRTIDAMMPLERLQNGIPNRMTGGPAMEENQWKPLPLNPQVQTFSIISNQAVHADQLRLPISSM